jgi:hypothetical protein
VLQRLNLQRGRAHSLAIERIEAADGITKDEKPLGKCRQPFIMTLNARGKPVMGEVRYALSILDEVVQLGCMQRLGKGQKPSISCGG